MMGAQDSGLVATAELVKEDGVVLADPGQAGMVCRQSFLEDRERTLEEWLGLGPGGTGVVVDRCVIPAWLTPDR
jgi:hypothetical protein